MKIKINKELFQWEKDRHVHIELYETDPQVTYVQFYNRRSKTGHEIELKNGKAKIPNYLLEEEWPITAAACTGEIGKTFVVARKEFTVLKRAKPVHYKDEEDNPDGEVEDITPSYPVQPDYPSVPDGPTDDDEIIYDGGEER